jgi:UDP-glucose 4-epimerase
MHASTRRWYVNALVTGGAGFIGHHLTRALTERGDRVVVLDDFTTGFRERLEPMGDKVRIIEGSILAPGDLDEAAAGCDVIFHQAALASVERSFVDPSRTNDVNVAGTIEVVLAAARQGVRRVIFAGSSSVYGVPEVLPCRESMKPSPESPYGVSKLAAEYYLHTIGARLGVETVVLRYFNVFGPAQDPASDYAAVIPLFITAVLDGRSPTINGDGAISRDFTYVDNVVAANLLAASAPDISGMTMNVACGERTTLLELLDAIGRALGKTVRPRFGPARVGDIKHSLADISLARKGIGYEVDVPFGEGIAATVEWYRDRAGASA